MSLHIQGMVLQRSDGMRLLGPLDLSLAKGDRLGLVGESGSGKSLLIQALFGVLPRGVHQSGGGITAFNKTLNWASSQGHPPWGARLAWMPQDPLAAMNPLLSLGEHLALLPAIHHKVSPGEALAQLAPLLLRLRLPTDPAFLSRFPHQISGGQRQRVCLAMALSCNPELLVLDEPTAALDPIVQKEFLDLMLDLQRDRGLGFLWITHDLAVASAVCDHLLVLYGGEPMEAGPTQALLTSPRHPYTARLLEAARHQPSEESGFLLAPESRPEGCPFAPRCSYQQVSCATWGPWRSESGQNPGSHNPSFGLRCENHLRHAD